MKKQDRLNITHIVVHKTGTLPDTAIASIKQLPYHYVVMADGELLNLRRVAKIESRISIAWVGGMDKNGVHKDNRTADQTDTLFSSLVMLSGRFPKAGIVAADELTDYAYANPGFDIKKWLADYIPVFLQS